MKKNRPTIIISAAGFEAKILKEKCASQGLAQVQFVALGIGIVRSHAGALNLKKSVQNANIIFIGTCGVFDAFTAPELYLVQTVCWRDLGERLNYSYRIAGDLPDLFLSKNHPAFQNLPPKICLCSASISLIPELGSLTESKQSCVENVELYGVASALALDAGSFTAVLCSTNLVGPDAHAAWKKSAPTAAEITADYILSKLPLIE